MSAGAAPLPPLPVTVRPRASLLRPTVRTTLTLTRTGVLVSERLLALGLLGRGTRELAVHLDALRVVAVRLTDSTPQLLIGLALIAVAAPVGAILAPLGAAVGLVGAAVALTSPVTRLRLTVDDRTYVVEVAATERNRLLAFAHLVERVRDTADP